MKGDNIDKGFEMMVSEIFKKYGGETLDEDEFGTVEKGEEINIDKQNTNKKKGCC